MKENYTKLSTPVVMIIKDVIIFYDEVVFGQK